MGKLAFYGDEMHSNSIIKLLCELGGKTTTVCKTALFSDRVYTINEYGDIVCKFKTHGLCVYNYSFFKKQYPFTIGDLVHYDDDVSTIYEVCGIKWGDVSNRIIYELKNTVDGRSVKDVMVAYLSAVKTNDENNTALPSPSTTTPMVGLIVSHDDKYELCYDKEKFEVVVENEKFYLKKKKTLFPTTFEKCCEILKVDSDFPDIVDTYCSNELMLIRKLFICRDVYWSLCDDWKPDWNDDLTDKFVITFNKDEYIPFVSTTEEYVLSFPNEDVRDLFYLYFSELIKQVSHIIKI